MFTAWRGSAKRTSVSLAEPLPLWQRPDGCEDSRETRHERAVCLRSLVHDELREHAAAADALKSQSRLLSRGILEQLVIRCRYTVRVRGHVTYDRAYVLYVVDGNGLGTMVGRARKGWWQCGATYELN